MTQIGKAMVALLTMPPENQTVATARLQLLQAKTIVAAFQRRALTSACVAKATGMVRNDSTTTAMETVGVSRLTRAIMPPSAPIQIQPKRSKRRMDKRFLAST